MPSPSIPQELQDRVRAKVDEYVRMAQEEWPHYTIPPIAIEYRNLGTTAGLAYCSIYKLCFHSILIVRDTEEFFDVLIGHEVAHIVSTYIFGNGISDHGDEWKEVMALYNISPARTHRLDTSGLDRKITRWKHKCKCPGRVHEFGSRINRHIMTKSQPPMVCLKCGSRIKPMEKPVRPKGLPKTLLHETKTNKAKWVIANNKGKPRSVIVQLLQEQAGLTSSGASTYYHNLVKAVVDNN